MQFISRIILILVFQLLVINTTLSKTKSNIRRIDTLAESSFYLVSLLQLTTHSGGFGNFAGCNCNTPDFNDALSSQFTLGIGWEKRFSSDFTVQNRMSFTNNLMQFFTDPIYNGSTSGNLKLYNLNNLNVIYPTINYHVITSYNIGSNFTFGIGVNFNLNFAPRFSFNQITVDENQLNNLEQAFATNSNKISSKFSYPGDMLFGLAPTISYRNNVIGNFEIEPEISYHIGLTDFVRDRYVNWNVNTLSVGLKFHWVINYQSYEIIPKTKVIKEELCPDGYVLDSLGNCKVKCPDGFYFDNTIKNCVQYNFDCPDGYLKDTLGNCVFKCPEGFIYDLKTKNCVQNNFDCPDSYQKDSLGNCVKIIKKILYEEISTKSNDRVNSPIIISETYDCPKGYIYNLNLNDCELLLPVIDSNCKGTYLGIQFNSLEDAETFEKFLKDELRLIGFTIQAEDSSKNINKYELQTGCFLNIQQAVNIQRFIYDKISNSGVFDEIEVILQTKK